MRKNYTWSVIFTLLFAAMAIYFLIPSFKLYSLEPEQQRIEVNQKPELRKKIVNLGLDLQGGMRLVLQVDRSKLKEKDDPTLLDRAYTIIENRINAIGLSEPTIQKVPQYDRLIIELPGLNDEKAAKEILGSTAKLYFHTLRDQAMLVKAQNAIDNALKGDVVREKAESVDSADTAAEDTTSESQQLADELFTGDEKSSEDELLALADAESSDETGEEDVVVTAKLFSEYASPYGNVFIIRETDKFAVSNLLKEEKVLAALKQAVPGCKLAWGYEVSESNGIKTRQLYLLKSSPEMSGEHISNAKSALSQGGMTSGQPIVNLEFNNKGAKQFARATGRNKGKQLAIVLDNTVYSAPRVNEKITMGSAQISGRFTREEAKNLAVVLQAGSLPAPVEIIEERTVGASLGHESIVKATWAAIIGFSLVLIFMVIYYKASGLLAISALFINIVFVLAIMASFGATLTLPGIAGLILTMGMSIDANVIIFERIKEELKIGKGLLSSIDAGYGRAFVTIMDANITTLFTALILFYVGSGPIRGFAITMMFGIIVSLFTALTFTKMIFHVIIGNGKKVKKLSI